MGVVTNRYGETIGTTSGKSYTDTSSKADNAKVNTSTSWSGGSSTSSGSTKTGSTTSSNSSKSSNSSVTPTSGGYAYIDKYGFSHVVSDYNTAQQYSGDGKVYGYNGAYGGGYAIGDNGARLNLPLAGAVPFSNGQNDIAGGGQFLGGTVYSDGTNFYEKKSDGIYKNGKLVPTENYKYIPTEIGGSYISPYAYLPGYNAPTSAMQYYSQNTAPTVANGVQSIVNPDVNKYVQEQYDTIIGGATSPVTNTNTVGSAYNNSNYDSQSRDVTNQEKSLVSSNINTNKYNSGAYIKGSNGMGGAIDRYMAGDMWKNRRIG